MGLARYDGSPGVREIRQYGLRRLWDEVEAAFRCWAAQGKPRLDQSRIIITTSAQTVVGMPTEHVRQARTETGMSVRLPPAQGAASRWVNSQGSRVGSAKAAVQESCSTSGYSV